MGGHIDQCTHDGCKRIHLSYNSCRNRHCPKCQGHLREEWITKRNEDLLNTSYFHVVFTFEQAGEMTVPVTVADEAPSS